MKKEVPLVLIGLAGLAFLLAIIGGLFDPPILRFTSPEGYSRACSNLALIAIALRVSARKDVE